MSKEFRDMLKEIWLMDGDQYHKCLRRYKKMQKIKRVDDLLKKEGV